MTRVRAAADGLATPSMATYHAQRASAGPITGIRLSPGGGFWGVTEDDTPELYAALLAALAPLNLAYVHIEATSDDDVLVELRKAWRGTLVVNPVLPLGPRITDREAADRWLGLGADLISFGRAFLANPDLVERAAPRPADRPARREQLFPGRRRRLPHLPRLPAHSLEIAGRP